MGFSFITTPNRAPPPPPRANSMTPISYPSLVGVWGTAFGQESLTTFCQAERTRVQHLLCSFVA